jgi:hypothetical protein
MEKPPERELERLRRALGIEPPDDWKGDVDARKKRQRSRNKEKV